MVVSEVTKNDILYYKGNFVHIISYNRILNIIGTLENLKIIWRNILLIQNIKMQNTTKLHSCIEFQEYVSISMKNVFIKQIVDFLIKVLCFIIYKPILTL